MVMKISKEILDYIRDSDFDKETQNFMIESLMLEFKRDKEDVRNYFNDYDRIIDKYVE